ncbi:hypothetical protein J14TS5_18250 [Paenibacillus lautus]|uniref:hypothetical protein n=1 Tax=Paenibacillus lautus TaxID=1401 RepID=UPI001B1EB90E|nr:hypothetical protein [Paenibacillus lautus]GIO96739.1 hypothetical protein J14TS5_18250 [Paenibacillus lautus]
MKKQLLLFLAVVLSMFLLFHVNQWMKNEYEIWTTIVNREWDAKGTGVYFYEENNQKYGLCIIYGSGLPVISSHKSKVRIINDHEFEMEIPDHLMNVQSTDQKLQVSRLKWNQGKLTMDGLTFDASETSEKHEWVLNLRAK